MSNLTEVEEPESIMLLPNGTVSFFGDKGQPIEGLSKSWVNVYLEWLELKGVSALNIDKIETIVNGQLSRIIPIKEVGSSGKCTICRDGWAEEPAVPLFYTGVFDCNGAEYKYGDLTWAKEGLMQVYFHDGRWMLIWQDTGTHYCDLHEAKHFEIVGNIYSKNKLKK